MSFLRARPRSGAMSRVDRVTYKFAGCYDGYFTCGCGGANRSREGEVFPAALQPRAEQSGTPTELTFEATRTNRSGKSLSCGTPLNRARFTADWRISRLRIGDRA